MNRKWSTLFMLLCLVAASTTQGQTREKGVPSSVSDVRSCKNFVQRFYDWYWNRFSDNPAGSYVSKSQPDVWTVVKHKRSVLAPELFRLLLREESEMRRTGDIGNLDFDPFAGNQDPQGRYVVTAVKVAESHCEAMVPQGSLTVLLEKQGRTWAIADIRYDFGTLKQMLSLP